MRVIDPETYPLKPFHFDISDAEGNEERNFHRAFDDFGRDRAAFVVVWMSAEGGRGFVPFARVEFMEFLARKGQGRRGRDLQYLELLIRDGYIVDMSDGLHVTHEFLARCFAVCPSGQYVSG